MTQKSMYGVAAFALADIVALVALAAGFHGVEVVSWVAGIASLLIAMVPIVAPVSSNRPKKDQDGDPAVSGSIQISESRNFQVGNGNEMHVRDLSDE